MGINKVSLLIYMQSCVTNPSGYLTRSNTNRETFVLRDNVISGIS
jgi:hypothetical protein